MLRRAIFFALAWLLGAGATLAAPPNTLPPVQTYPAYMNLVNQSSTIAVTNTFQEAFASSTERRDCMIQNTGTNAMYVFPGAVASATIATSVKLTAGTVFYCAFNGLTYAGTVAITGTATETYYASHN